MQDSISVKLKKLTESYSGNIIFLPHETMEVIQKYMNMFDFIELARNYEQRKNEISCKSK